MPDSPAALADTNTAVRPQFHFTARGWINDPHAISVIDGQYHHFFQYVPGATTWQAGCSWGHSSGRDLFSLQELPVALEPGEGDDGIWSGSIMTFQDGVPRIFYTSVSAHDLGMGRVRVATPTTPDLLEWEKGPVVAVAPPEAGVRSFRDPVIVADGENWRMLVGVEFADGRAGAIGYVSSDGVDWREAGEVAARSGSEHDPVWTGSMWECPQLVAVDDHYALLVSVWDADVLHDVAVAVGSFDDGVFTPSEWSALSYGPSPYAATTFEDAAGHACVQFWLRGVSGVGWSGAHSIPYRLSAGSTGLALTPHPDIEKYFGDDVDGGGAADILWPAASQAILRIHDREAIPIAMRRDGGDLHILLGTAEYRVPSSGDVRIIVDGPILEVSSRAGLFAAPIKPLSNDWRLEGSGATRRWLVQQARA